MRGTRKSLKLAQPMPRHPMQYHSAYTSCSHLAVSNDIAPSITPRKPQPPPKRLNLRSAEGQSADGLPSVEGIFLDKASPPQPRLLHHRHIISSSTPRPSTHHLINQHTRSTPTTSQAAMDQPTWNDLLNDKSIENLLSPADIAFYAKYADLVSSAVASSEAPSNFV